jgi:hypothetical protein
MKPGEANGYLTRARALGQRAEACGATLVAWSAMTVGFAFDLDGLEEAIDLVTSIVSEPVIDVDRWACGVAQGPLESLAVANRSELAWGEALVISLTLARVARAGEVLIHPSLVDEQGALRLLEARVANDGGVEVRGSRLDGQNPWRRRPSQIRMEPFLNPTTARKSSIPPATIAIPRPPNEASGTATQAQSPPPPLAAARAALGRQLPPPRVPPPRASVTNEAGAGATIVQAPPHRLPSSPDIAARALVARDRSALETWASDLASDGPGTFTRRMRAFVDLARGDVGPALRTLEKVRTEAKGAARGQAALAYAVALAAAGRIDDALLEALDSLARARETGDGQAAEACVRFLSLLTERRQRFLESNGDLSEFDEDEDDYDVDVDGATP